MIGDIVSCLYSRGKVFCIDDWEVAEGSGVIVVSDGVGKCCTCCS